MGVHAAGVIMSSEPIIDHVPVWVRHTDGVIITQLDYPSCESLGLLKMDFLGLRNLTIMDDAVKMDEGQQGQRHRPASAAAGRPARPSNCSSAATPSASSSSTAAPCARCCAR